jgi:antitoxin component HigA of HigAB toxin-antitoxin module
MPKSILKLELFQPDLLKDLGEDAVDVALLSVNQFVRLDTFKFVLQVALEQQGCLEFLFSCTSARYLLCDTISIIPLSLALPEDQFNFALKWVDETFPHDLENYSAESLCIRLLATISISLQLFPYVNTDYRPRDLASSHEYVVHSNSVLQALASVTQRPVSEIEERSSKMSQKARKNVKRSQQTPKSFDMTPFRALHLEVPPSPQKGKEMALEILAKQKGILVVTMFALVPLYYLTHVLSKSYLKIFRLESLADAFRRNYIPSSQFEAIVDDRSAPQANPSDEAIEMPEEVPAAYPQVQPMKAALYFDSAEGFGQWRILISGRANRNLREMRKKDANLFHITLKKIKYPFLSLVGLCLMSNSNLL